MIISFFGHRHFYGTEAHQKLLFSLLEKHIRGADVSFYLGNYGGFDQFAFKVAKQYQKNI